MKWVTGYSALLKESVKKDIYILTAFGFYVGVTRKDLKYSIGNIRYKYLLDLDYNVVYIRKMVKI